MNPHVTKTTARTRDAAATAKADPKTTGTTVAKAGANQVPAHLRAQVKADAGQGVSSSSEDSMVPMLTVLQGQSPQTMKMKPEYIKDAQPGDILLKNAPVPVVKALGAEAPGILVQSCYFYKNVVEWIPRNPDGTGGGYVAEHKWFAGWESSDWAKGLGIHEVVDDKDGSKSWMDKDEEHEFIETRNHAVILYPEGGTPLPYLIPLSSSGHAVSRQWTFMMRNKTLDGAQVPSFAVLYRLKTNMRTKGNNNWYVLDPKEGGPDGDTLWASAEQYAAGKALHDAFAAGTKKVEMGAEAAPGGPAEGDSKTAAASQHI